MILVNTVEDADKLAEFLNDGTTTTEEALRLYRAATAVKPPYRPDRGEEPRGSGEPPASPSLPQR